MASSASKNALISLGHASRVAMWTLCGKNLPGYREKIEPKPFKAPFLDAFPYFPCFPIAPSKFNENMKLYRNFSSPRKRGRCWAMIARNLLKTLLRRMSKNFLARTKKPLCQFRTQVSYRGSEHTRSAFENFGQKRDREMLAKLRNPCVNLGNQRKKK